MIKTVILTVPKKDSIMIYLLFIQKFAPVLSVGIIFKGTLGEIIK